jgi:cbb3-type cytochrome oxidase maturation protein
MIVISLRSPSEYFYSKLSFMSAIIILLLASISVAALFLGAFIWSVRSGQYDDEFSPAQRILFDDKPPAPPTDNK